MSFLSTSLLKGIGGGNIFGSPLAGVLDEATKKAKELEGQTKSSLKKAADRVESEANRALGTVQNQIDPKTPKRHGIELYTPKYYYTCALGGILACGITHAFVTPLDLVKCRRQVDKNIYKGNVDGWKKIYSTEGGIRGLYTGVGPTFAGYSVQGACKYGFYEFFKKKYADMAGPENAIKYKDAIYLAGSASAEFIADTAYVPFEAAKVRMQTTIPPFATGFLEPMKKFAAIEGVGGFYKSLPSLWSRQIPYTMMKFWSFEATVSYIYGSVLGKPKDSYNKVQQLGVSFLGGYIAGIFCAIVSHPADNLVSKLNAETKAGQTKATVGSVISEVGWVGLATNGLPVRIVMIGTLTALQWLIYDYVKVFSGLPTTGSVEKK